MVLLLSVLPYVLSVACAQLSCFVWCREVWRAGVEAAGMPGCCCCCPHRLVVAVVCVRVLLACRTADGSWNVLDSVWVTLAKGAPAGVCASSCSRNAGSCTKLTGSCSRNKHAGSCTKGCIDAVLVCVYMCAHLAPVQACCCLWTLPLG